MKKSFVLMLALAVQEFLPLFGRNLCCGIDSCCRVVEEDAGILMRKEAQAFLSSLPDGLQKSQEDAVRSAIRGDVSALYAVRSSRNREPEVPDDVKTQDIGRHYRLFRPAGYEGTSLPVLVYLHGGGWCFGSINSCTRFCAELSRKAKMAVLAVDYPLAPEHPYPAALDACTEAVMFAYGYAAEYGFDSGRISVGGDSAGGNLALSVALNLMLARKIVAGQVRKEAEDDIPRLHSLVLFYPVTKAWADGSQTWQEYGEGYGLDAGLMDAFNEAYVGSADARLPLVSPGEASDEWLGQLPPTLIVNAAHDILLGQGMELAGRLSQAGISVCHSVLPGTVHLFITVPGQPTAFNRSVELAADFLNAR